MDRKITQLICGKIALIAVAAATLIMGTVTQVVGRPDDDPNWFIRPPQFVETNDWGAVTNYCQLGLRLTRREFVSGGPIHFYVYFRNVGTCTVEYADSQQLYEYEVENTSTRHTPACTEQYAEQLEPAQRMGGSMRAEVVGPQEQHLNRFSLTERYKMEEPGTYVIRVKQKVWLAEVLSRRPLQTRPIGNFDLLSNPVTITVVPKPEK